MNTNEKKNGIKTVLLTAMLLFCISTAWACKKNSSDAALTDSVSGEAQASGEADSREHPLDSYEGWCRLILENQAVSGDSAGMDRACLDWIAQTYGEDVLFQVAGELWASVKEHPLPIIWIPADRESMTASQLH